MINTLIKLIDKKDKQHIKDIAHGMAAIIKYIGVISIVIKLSLSSVQLHIEILSLSKIYVTFIYKI